MLGKERKSGNLSANSFFKYPRKDYIVEKEERERRKKKKEPP
jgi:hypothetical protein